LPAERSPADILPNGGTTVNIIVDRACRLEGHHATASGRLTMASQLYERRDIWSLTRESEWHPVIGWYASAIDELSSIEDTSDPKSWWYLASIHGSSLERPQWPSGVQDWNSCQHASWFFLPWHRIYLHHFETIVRTTVLRLGGPSDWALPFWNYNPSDPETLALPPAFRARDVPIGLPFPVTGRANPLFVAERVPAINGGARLNPVDVEVSGWTSWFATDSTVVPSFGGPRTGWTHMGPAFGQLETEPHGLIHMRVGGSSPPGYMTLFETAGLDPIFWLHHANIDRLWEVWRGAPGHQNPPDPAWLNQPFEFGRDAMVTKLSRP
jgi:tyrosinase